MSCVKSRLSTPLIPYARLRALPALRTTLTRQPGGLPLQEAEPGCMALDHHENDFHCPSAC